MAVPVATAPASHSRTPANARHRAEPGGADAGGYGAGGVKGGAAPAQVLGKATIRAVQELALSNDHNAAVTVASRHVRGLCLLRHSRGRALEDLDLFGYNLPMSNPIKPLQ